MRIRLAQASKALTPILLTVSGILTLTPNSNNVIILKKTTDVLGTAPGSNQYTSISIVDNNDANVSFITRGHYSNGHTELNISLIGQSTKSATLSIRMRPDDTGYLRITKPDGTTTDLATW